MGGKAVIKVPYRENLLQYAKQAGCKYDFVHLRTYNKQLLSDLLRNAGFSPEKFHFDGYQTFNIRPYLINSQFLYKRFKRYLWPTGRPEDLAKFPNWLGRLFVKPSEI